MSITSSDEPPRKAYPPASFSVVCPLCRAGIGEPCRETRAGWIHGDRHNAIVRIETSPMPAPPKMERDLPRSPGDLADRAMRHAREANAGGNNALAADLIEMSAALRVFEKHLERYRQITRDIKRIVGT
jgi:hypothetical protein